MRGKGTNNNKYKFGARITPAYAGKRTSLCLMPVSIWDHPRLCGEKYINYFFPVKFLGSPPPMRGKAMTIVFFLLALRITPAYAGKRNTDTRRRAAPHGITPAYAGKRFSIGWMSLSQRDHPRLCGEKQRQDLSFPHDRGITPAYAGKSGR